MRKSPSIIGAGLSLVPVLAHCPLCTMGAGAAAAGAAYLGIGTAPIGVFIGAFAIATGLWMNRYLPQKITYQPALIAALSFALTIIPMLKLFPETAGWYVRLAGGYGSLLNRTYGINLFFAGGVLGSAIMFLSPALSRGITNIRKKSVPFQGMALTFGMLLLSAALLEVILL